MLKYFSLPILITTTFVYGMEQVARKPSTKDQRIILVNNTTYELWYKVEPQLLDDISDIKKITGGKIQGCIAAAQTIHLHPPIYIPHYINSKKTVAIPVWGEKLILSLKQHINQFNKSDEEEGIEYKDSSGEEEDDENLQTFELNKIGSFQIEYNQEQFRVIEKAS